MSWCSPKAAASEAVADGAGVARQCGEGTEEVAEPATTVRRPSWAQSAVHWRREAPAGAHPKVLLIDEGRDSHVALERVALRVGAVVHHARRAADALRFALTLSYDAIILDAALGTAGLISLLEQLHAKQPAAAILLSGRPGPFPEGCALLGNLLGSVRKPWDEEEIEVGLRRAFDLSTARRTQRPHGGTRAPFERLLFIGTAADARRIERMLRGSLLRGGLVHAGQLEEAALLSAQQPFDAVLTSLSLPDACGLDAVLRLRRQAPQTPIVVIADVDDGPLHDQALQAGAQDVLLEREIDEAGLVRSLRHARQRQRIHAHLHHDVHHDELTSLAKRALFHQRIANALARSRRIGNTFAVIYIDLDHFKGINDTHGHHVGDAVLVTVSERLRAAVREYDTVARLGGDEFAILLDTLDDPGEAETVAQRVLGSLSMPVQVANQNLGVTASMGISVFPDGGSAPEDLLRSADQAMYCAKRAGRNTYSLAPSSRPPAMDEPPSRRALSPAAATP
jgi:two-component system cell cycle response regulator